MKYFALFFLNALVFCMMDQSMKLHKTQKLFDFVNLQINSKSIKRNLLGEMPLTDEDNYQYYGTFSLGTPAQTLNLVMDTSEDQTWVSPKFITANSTSANVSKTTGNFTYGGGSIIGYYGTDLLAQKELFLNNVNISLLFATSVINLPALDQDGVIGLTNNKNFQNFIDKAAAAKQINDSVFAFNVNNMYSTSDFYAGTPSFPARLSLVWIDSVSTTVWQIPIASMAINTTSFALTQATALIDTSISMIVIPQAPFDNLVNSVAAYCQSSKYGDYYLCDCGQTSVFPILYFVTGTYTMQVGPKQYLDLGSGEFCFLGVYPVKSSTMTFGDAFLKNYFIAFDKVNNKIAYSTPNKPHY